MNAIDISKWQWDRVTVPPRTPDFDLLATKADIVICKCGQGDFEDYAFADYMRELKARGVYRGSYWFYDNRVDAKRQAQNYSKYLRLHGLEHELPCFIDYEVDYPTAAPSRLQDVYDFIAEFQRLEPDRTIGIYTGYYFWTASAQYSHMTAAGLQWFAQFPLWLAWYTHDENNSTPVKIPQPWNEWMLWQYTDRGDGFGHGLHSKELDLNKTNRPHNEWIAKWANGTTNPDNGNGVETMYKYSMTAISNGTRLRPDHNTVGLPIDIDPSQTGVQSFNAGDLLEGDSYWMASVNASGGQLAGDEWVHVIARNGKPLMTPGWVAKRHAGSTICNNFKINDVTNPPPTGAEIPVSFEATFKDGSKALYNFVKIL